MKEEYESLKKKFELPDFEKINYDFEISAIEQKEFLLRNIKRKISEKLISFAELIESLIQPEKPSTMYEAGCLSENERKSNFEIYRRLMHLIRLSEEISLDEDEKKSADFIKKSFNEWNSLKKELGKTMSKVRESWTKQLKKEEEEYFG